MSFMVSLLLLSVNHLLPPRVPVAGPVRDWGRSSGRIVRYLYPFRATDLEKLKTAGYPIGERRDRELRAALEADKIVCAWGKNATKRRVQEAKTLLDGGELYCIGTVEGGQPMHPWYPGGSKHLIPFIF